MNEQEKTLIIMRGVSGSGKSTLAKQLAGGDAAKIISTDDFFGTDPEEYRKNFDGAKLAMAHRWAMNRADEAMEQGVTPVIIDNTNTRSWEAQPYAEMAAKHGYRVEIREPESDVWQQIAPLLHNKGANKAEIDQVADILASRNTHGVPKKSILRMLNRWEPNLDI